MAKRKKKVWSHSEGRHGAKVRVFDTTNGIIYGETADSSLPCGVRCMSLRHRDKDEAKRWAQRQAAQLTGGSVGMDRRPTLSRVLALYLKNQSPNKSSSEQLADERRAKLWARTLGPGKDLSRLTMAEWQGFVTARRAGAIDSDGLPVEADQRKVVRDGTVAGDLTFLISVINWACKWREEDRYLMSENPARGYPVPVEKNPRRPLVTEERFQKVRAVAHLVTMRVGHGKKSRELQTYLPQVLDLCWGVGRRISAILALRYTDLRLGDGGPHGSILFPAATDKMGKEWLAPMSLEVRAAIDRILAERPGIGKAFLFPSFTREGEPVRQDAVALWLRSAEILAGVPKQGGSLFHAYRRSWATSRKFFPLVDVAAAGGWSDTATLLKCYQQADSETMYRVVSEPAKLTGTL